MAHVFGGGKHHHEEKKGEGASERTGVGTKEGTWWVGCREDMYIGLYCNEATVEDRSSRSDSQMQVSSTLLSYSFYHPSSSPSFSSSSAMIQFIIFL
jgi:hypothetical protein